MSRSFNGDFHREQSASCSGGGGGGGGAGSTFWQLCSLCSLLHLSCVRLVVCLFVSMEIDEKNAEMRMALQGAGEVASWLT